jgi:phage terminase large subunit GpA-like protein
VAPADWVAAHVLLSDLEAAKGRYDLDGRPWFREILDAIGDPTTRTIAIVASTQLGKTLLLCAAICYLAANSPAAALVVLPTQDDAREFRERLYRLAEASGLRIPPEGRWNMRYLQIEGMRVYLAWSGSRQRMRGRRCKYVFLTEIDVYDSGRGGGGDPIEAAKQRVKAFPRYLILAETTPVPEVSRIDTIEQEPERQRRRWAVRCPHCGAEQELRFFAREGRGGFGGVTDRDGRTVDPDRARQQVHYVCTQGCRIEPADVAAMVRGGRWLTRNPERSARDLGFALWSVHSDVGLATIVAEYCRAVRDGGVPDWWQNWLGRSHKSRGALPKWEQLGRRLAVPHYARGQVPADVWFLTATVDVQERELFAVVRGWGDQQSSWLVDWWTIERREGDESDVIKSDLARLDELVMDAWFPVAGRNPRGRERLQVALLGIDSNYRPLDVHEWTRAHNRSPRIRQLRGDGNMSDELRYKMGVVKESRREKDDGSGPVVYEGGKELWSIAVTPFRLLLVDRFRGSDSHLKPGAWLLPSNVLETGTHYLRQLVNEPPKYVKGKDGRPRLVWEEEDTHLGHDFWDCEVYNIALAQMLVDQIKGNPGWDASKWDRGERAAETPRPAVAGRASRSARPAGRKAGPVNRSAR